MSNLDTRPDEVECAAGQGDRMEVLQPRDVPLGGPRAMRVRRTLPHRQRSLIGAWCFVDHYGPDPVDAGGAMTLPPHPHTGLQTVSWVFDGAVEHRDSAGFQATARPGTVNLMTAGSGISHSEVSTPDSRSLHGVQLWVALPEHSRFVDRTFEHHRATPVTGRGFEGLLFIGELLGERSPARVYTPLVGAQLTIDSGTTVEIPVQPAFEHGLLVDTGELAVDTAGSGPARSDGSPLLVSRHELGYVGLGANVLRLRAGESPLRLLLLGGVPLGERIVMWWNFVGRSHEEIVRYRETWEAELAGRPAPGNGDGRPTFGLPPSDPLPPLPAPALPQVTLRPRG